MPQTSISTEFAADMTPNGPREQHAERSSSKPERLRVLHVFNYLGLGGTELTALRLVTHLEKSGFENRLCGLRGQDAHLLAQRFPEADVTAMPNRIGGQFSTLRKYIRQLRPHIVHSRNWGAIEAVPAAKLAGVPIAIHSEHGYEIDTLVGLPLRRRLFRRAVYEMTDAVFAVTEELRGYHARQAWISPSRIRVLANGIDTDIFAPQHDARRIVLDRAGVSNDRFVVGSVGRLVPIKDHGILLKAAERLSQRGVNVHVLLVGSGPELIRHQEFLKTSVALAGRVTLLGATSKVSEVMNAMDVFVLPSISEGMSNTLLEAMACGLPVVATQVGGNTEVVGEPGRCGCLFAPGDINGLAEQLERLAIDSNARRNMGMAARERGLKMFSMQRMVEAYRHLYLELAERRGLLSRSSL
jgi:sugar transferase (PEP-CTERM/EpsH1 system associated)